MRFPILFLVWLGCATLLGGWQQAQTTWAQTTLAQPASSDFVATGLLASHTEQPMAAPPRVQWNLLVTSSSGEAQRRLRTPVRFYWDQQPLRACLQTISQASGLAIWLDRRIDPSQLVNYTPQDSTTSKVWPSGSLGGRLDEIAEQLKLKAGLIENVLYLGPQDETLRLQRAAITLQDSLYRQVPALARQQKPLVWRELTTSQQLLEQIATDWEIDVAGELPHDLLHRGELPPAHLATQLVLACGGFGLEPMLVEPKRIELKPLGEEGNWIAGYEKKQVRSQEASKLRSDFPAGAIKDSGQSLLLAGPTDFHLASLLPAARQRSEGQRGSTRGGKAGKVTVWSFAIDKAPAEAILASLSSGMGLQFVWSRACTTEHKTQLLTLKVDQADLDQLLTQVCEAANLRYTREGNRVELSPK